MSSMIQPKIAGFKAAAAIAKGKAVKFGADKEHVAVCSAASDKQIGLVQSASTAAEDLIEVALPGGGGLALAGGTISAGDLLAADSNGALVATTSNADRHIAMAMEDAVANDVFSVLVIAGIV